SPSRYPACAASWRPPASILDDLDRHRGAVGHGKPCLLLKSRTYVTVACGARVAKTVEHKQLGRDRLAAIVTLAFLGVDADPHRFLRPSGNVFSLADPSRCRSSFLVELVDFLADQTIRAVNRGCEPVPK